MFDIIEDMTKTRPNFIFKLCWKYLTPLVSLVCVNLYFYLLMFHILMLVKNSTNIYYLPALGFFSHIVRISFILLLQVSLVCSLVQYKPLTFNRWYVYPDWAYALGWLLALSSILLVPGWALVHLLAGKGSLREVRIKTCPSLLLI